MIFKLKKTGVIIDPNTFEPVINFNGTMNWQFKVGELNSSDYEKIGKDFMDALGALMPTSGGK